MKHKRELMQSVWAWSANLTAKLWFDNNIWTWPDTCPVPGAEHRVCCQYNTVPPVCHTTSSYRSEGLNLQAGVLRLPERSPPHPKTDGCNESDLEQQLAILFTKMLGWGGKPLDLHVQALHVLHKYFKSQPKMKANIMKLICCRLKKEEISSQNATDLRKSLLPDVVDQWHKWVHKQSRWFHVKYQYQW